MVHGAVNEKEAFKKRLNEVINSAMQVSGRSAERIVHGLNDKGQNSMTRTRLAYLRNQSLIIVTGSV
jgi:hypothetical protein